MLPPHAPIWLLAETAHWLAVSKTPGQSVERQPGANDTLEDQVRAYLWQGQSREPYLGIVHRLDRVTSGVVLFAKKKSSLVALQQQWPRVSKKYWAQTTGPLPALQGVLEHWLAKDLLQKRSLAFTVPGPQRQHALLRYRRHPHPDRWQWEIELQTGRFHQIRVQCAAVGAPIIGDVIYGAPEPLPGLGIALHAHTLTFRDPNTELPITLEAPPPF